ncbi:hypothetical protein KUV57_13330 [Epibacterium sp. DP7N7-1]|nr:hypothetical protein [Epibacterium sp. DP7N7-1]
MTKKPSPNQMVVLNRLMETVASEAYMTVPQFADVATSSKLIEEWAITPLKALEKMNMVERTPKKVGKASTWRITTLGVEAVMQHRKGARL